MIKYRFKGERLLPLFFLSCVLLITLQSCTNRRQSVRIGLNAWPGYDAFFWAEQQKYFNNLSVDVELVEFESLGDARRAFERGQVDLIGTTVVELLFSRIHTGWEGKTIYVFDYSNGSDMFLVHPSIASLRDVKGKRIAAEPGSVDILMAHLALTSVGLTLKDVTLAGYSSQGEALSAYKRGELDAVEGYPPVAVELVRLGAKRLFDSSQAPGVVLDVLVAEQNIVERNPHVLAEILGSFEKAQGEVLNRNPEALQFLSARVQLTPEEYLSAFSGLAVVPRSEQHLFLRHDGKFVDSLKKTQEALLSANQIDSEVRLDGLFTNKIINLLR
ncbi:MAG: ABC transporter substrate-binding protein [Bdellovibrionales bacterium]|nr:ABC transporter substrate-binding protein [Bdellovibrionales bacterium]